MKLILLLLLAGMPAAASAGSQAVQPSVAAMPADFESDVEGVSARLREEMRAFRVNARSARLMSALGRRDPAGAQSALAEMLQASPELKDNPEVKLHQGEVYFLQGDYRAAYVQNDAVIKRLEQIYGARGPRREENNSSENSFIAGAHFNRATAGMRVGMAEQAVRDIDRAMAFSSAAYMPLNKCRALLMLGRYQEAAEAYDLTFKMDAATAGSKDKKRICDILKSENVKANACGPEESK